MRISDWSSDVCSSDLVHAPESAWPTATYRVQLHSGFRFDDAAALAPYLAALGISHLYCSPILQAVPGSTHGYDVVDHGQLSEDLGGAAGFGRLVDTMAEHGLSVDRKSTRLNSSH